MKNREQLYELVGETGLLELIQNGHMMTTGRLQMSNAVVVDTRNALVFVRDNWEHADRSDNCIYDTLVFGLLNVTIEDLTDLIILLGVKS